MTYDLTARDSPKKLPEAASDPEAVMPPSEKPTFKEPPTEALAVLLTALAVAPTILVVPAPACWATCVIALQHPCERACLLSRAKMQIKSTVLQDAVIPLQGHSAVLLVDSNCTRVQGVRKVF